MAELADHTVVLITGANRGLGLALCAQYLQRPKHIILAGVRSFSKSVALEALPKGANTQLLFAIMDSSSPDAAAAAGIAALTNAGVAHLDIVIANAGISAVHPLAQNAALADLREHFEVNTLAPLALFQAARPLLQAAAAKRKGHVARFVGMSSSAASIGGMDIRPVPNSVYGPSKVALNYLVRKMHYENEDLVCLCVDPGWVKTEMGNDGAVEFLGPGREAETEVEDSVAGMLKIIDSATREKDSGEFLHFEGGSCQW